MFARDRWSEDVLGRVGTIGIVAGVCALTAGAPAAAQDQAPAAEATQAAAAAPGVVSYPASYFATMRPTTAKEMVERTPGFVLDKGNGSRGYGGAGGNVLIDGQRPASKSTPIDSVLSRISSSEVERVDVIRGGAPGIDMQGQSVIANVVRKGGTARTAALHLFRKQYFNGFGGYFLRGEAGIRTKTFSAEGQVAGRRDISADSGDGSISRIADRGASPYEAGDFDGRYVTRNFSANGSAEYRPAIGVLRMNAVAQTERNWRRETGSLFGLTGPFQETTRVDRHDNQYELGADYEFPVAEGLKAELIALQRLERETLASATATPRLTQASNERSNSNESIARAVLRWSQPWGDLEGGVEGAYNQLDARSSLRANGVAINLPSANVKVAETRGEAFVTGTFRPLEGLTLETGLRVESSTIEQTGGANQKKTLTFPKPRIGLTYGRGESQVSLRVERTVGQLNFKDFAASSELDSNAVKAGNADLEPERAWVTELAIERRFWGAGAAVLTLSHSEVQSVVDLIPVAGLFDGPGNIGDGTKDELRLTMNAPLDRLGLGPSQARLTATWRRSKVFDPVTGERRPISALRPFEGEAEISRGLPAWKSTVGVEGKFGFEETTYRINEIRRVAEAPVVTLYWDWTPRPTLLIRFQAENLLQRERTRDRTVFLGPRSAGVVAFREHRETELPMTFNARARFVF